MRFRIIGALACGVSLLAMFTGCTENPPASQPTPTPPVTSITTPTPSEPVTPQAPVMPAEAKAKTKSGLQAFATYWISAKDFMSRTGQIEQFLALNRMSCEWCTRLASSYRQTYAAGGYYSGTLETDISEFHLIRLVDQSSADVQFRARISGSARVATKGANSEPLKPAVRDYTLNLDYTSQGWKVERASWKTVEATS